MQGRSLVQGPWGEPSGRQQAPFEAFSTIDPAVWQGREPPRRDWMVENCFLRGTVALVSGDGGIGKSLLMQQLCTCAVLGRPWLGMALGAGRALYLACEDDQDELWRRQAAINRSLDAEMADVGEAGLALKPRVGQDNALMRFDRASWSMQETNLWRQLVRHCRDRGVQYVVIDTATQTFRGNQNDESQVMDYISLLRRLAIQVQGVVIITKHPSMAGRALGTGESGNVAWNNSVRARLYLCRNKGGDLVLRGMKSNYGKKLDDIPVQWRGGTIARIEAPPPVNYYDGNCILYDTDPR